MEVEMGKFAWLPGQTKGTPLVDAGQTFLFDDDDWSFRMRIEFFSKACSQCRLSMIALIKFM